MEFGRYDAWASENEMLGGRPSIYPFHVNNSLLLVQSLSWSWKESSGGGEWGGRLGAPTEWSTELQVETWKIGVECVWSEKKITPDRIDLGHQTRGS